MGKAYPQAKLAVKDEYTFDFAELSPEYSEHELKIGEFETEYALKRSNVPIGMTTYQLSEFV